MYITSSVSTCSDFRKKYCDPCVVEDYNPRLSSQGLSMMKTKKELKKQL